MLNIVIGEFMFSIHVNITYDLLNMDMLYFYPHSCVPALVV